MAGEEEMGAEWDGLSKWFHIRVVELNERRPGLGVQQPLRGNWMSVSDQCGFVNNY